nr:hypothetical protein [Candidatus Sigynarchaeota archaeon]
MSEGNKDMNKKIESLGFIDQIADGLRTVGESLQIQGLVDDAFYMASKYALEFILNAATKFKIEGTPDYTANRGVIFTALVSTPADIALMTQVASKKMAFVVDSKHVETPLFKSVLKAFGVIATLDDLLTGEKDADIFQWIRANRKILTVVVDDSIEHDKIEKIYERVMRLARDGFCPIIPVGISGSQDIKPGTEIMIKIGSRHGVNQSIKDQDLGAMAKDFIVKLQGLKVIL